MPFAKTSSLKSNDIDMATRSLRQRKITYPLTNSLPLKNSNGTPNAKSNASIENEKGVSVTDSLPRRSSRITSPKNFAPDLSVEIKEEPNSSFEDSKLTETPEERPKRIYRKKSIAPVEAVLGPRKRSKPICRLGCCPPGASHKSGSEVEDDCDDNVDDDSEEEEFIPQKRTYRKQSFGENQGSRPRRRPKSVCNLEGCCALSSSFVEIDMNFKRKLFRKKYNSYDVASNSCPSSPASFLEIDMKQGKRVYRKKGFTEEDSFSATSSKNYSEVSNCNSPRIKKEPLSSPESRYDASFQERPYIRRSFNLSCHKRLEPTVASPNIHDDIASLPPTLSTPKKRLPKVPHNTPVCATKISLPSEDILLPALQKRGRGRPPKTRGRGRPRKVPESEVSDVESTSVSSTTLTADTDADVESLASQRRPVAKPRKSRPWEFLDVKQEEEEEPISEYELMRQRNIQENLQMMRQLFLDSGLEFNDKTSEETKKKKPYTRLPLPPPRPKSARLEVRKSTGLLDFSKFSKRISLG